MIRFFYGILYFCSNVFYNCLKEWDGYMIGLALEGGGAKGAYQAGAYMALKKCRIKIKAVAGTSIGSLNGALIASRDEDKMVELWKDVSMREILGIDDERAMRILHSGISLADLKWSFAEFYKIFKNKGLDMSNYRALVRNNVDEQKLRKSKIKYGLTTVKVSNMKPLEVYLEDIPDGKLHDYIVASSFLPVFKKERLIDDEYYLDGGFYNLCPTDMLEHMGCDKIYAINIKGIGIRKSNKNSKAEIIEIKPKGNLGSIIVFDKEQNENNMAYGYYDTMRVLGKIEGIEYYLKKHSNWYYKRLNHRVSDKLYNAVKMVVRSNDYKETVIKAIEYILKKENANDLLLYRQKDIIRSTKKITSDNIVYMYVSSLSLW